MKVKSPISFPCVLLLCSFCGVAAQTMGYYCPAQLGPITGRRLEPDVIATLAVIDDFASICASTVIPIFSVIPASSVTCAQAGIHNH